MLTSSGTCNAILRTKLASNYICRVSAKEGRRSPGTTKQHFLRLLSNNNQHLEDLRQEHSVHKIFLSSLIWNRLLRHSVALRRQSLQSSNAFRIASPSFLATSTPRRRSLRSLSTSPSSLVDYDSYDEDTMCNSEETNALGYPKLQPRSPVPSDIEVSQQIVREVGLLSLGGLAKQYVSLFSERLVRTIAR